MSDLPKGSILVVEDEGSIRQGLCDVLTFRGHRVVGVVDGSQALDTLRREGFDLVLLDVMLPEIDGFTVCRTLRSEGIDVTVLMLTAKGSEDDVVAGFEAGADDYVTKPFGVRELLARVSALLKRARPPEAARFDAGPITVDASRSSAKIGETETELTAREIGILRLLSADPGRIVSRRMLLREVWEMNNADAVETRTVDVHVAKLRKKLGAAGAVLETVRGQGYRLAAGGKP